MTSPSLTFSPGSSSNDVHLAWYQVWLEQQPLTPNTRRAYHSRVKQFFLFFEYASLGDQCQDSLSGLTDAMPHYLNFLKKSKNTDRATINANINALNNFAIFLNLQDPQLKREHCYAKQARVLAPYEQNKFLDSVERQESTRDKALALVLFSTGLRIGECARLDGSDIVEGVTGIAGISLRDRTMVALNEQTASAVRQWLAERHKLVLRETDSGNSGLWLTKSAQRLSVSGIAFVIKRIGWQANLLVSAEMLRRTWLATATVDLSKQEMASKFGGYINSATITKYALFP